METNTNTDRDRDITCGDCGKVFPFTVKEQQFFKSKGYNNDPKRCRNCRRQRRHETEDHEARKENRQMRGMPDAPHVGRR